MIVLPDFFGLINSWLARFSKNPLSGLGLCRLFFYLCGTLNGRRKETPVRLKMIP